MSFTFQCDYCGATVTRERKHGRYPHIFCGYSCAAKWRAKNGCAPTGPRSVAGGLPHKNVRIRMTKELELFPEFRPEQLGEVIEAVVRAAEQDAEDIEILASMAHPDREIIEELAESRKRLSTLAAWLQHVMEEAEA